MTKPATPQTVEYLTSDGITLRADAYGESDQPAVLLAHGGGQTRHAWGSTAAVLADAGWYAVSMDLRGHGESDWASDQNYSLNAFADDLRCVATGFKERPAVVGASLGGIAAILAEGESEGDVFSSLVLVDITPRIQMEGAERILRFMSANLERGFASVEEAARAVAAYLPHRQPPENLDGLRKNLRLCKDERYRWHWDPSFISRKSSTIELETIHLHKATRHLRLPCLLLRGSRSDLVSEQAVREFQDLVPHAQYRDVSGAGHMVAGDQNGAFTTATVEFLTKLR